MRCHGYLQQAAAEQQLAQQRAQQVAAAAVAAGTTPQVAIIQGQQVVTTATTIQVITVYNFIKFIYADSLHFFKVNFLSFTSCTLCSI